MSDSIVSRGLLNATIGEQAWPYVTLPIDEFAAHAGHETSFSRNHLVYTSPIIHDVSAWNVFNAAVSSGSKVPYKPYIFTNGKDGEVPANGTGPYIPIHQIYTENVSPVSSNNSINNYDTFSEPGLATAFAVVSAVRHSALTRLLPLMFIRESYPEIFDGSEPLSMFVEPIFSNFQDTSEIVGYVQSLFDWKFFFSNLISDDVSIICVVENTCGDNFTYIISNHSALYTSFENARISMFDGTSATLVVGTGEIPNGTIESEKAAGVCIYTLTVYPTKEFRKAFNANAVIYTVVIGMTMLSMVGAFFAYDS